MGKTYRYGHRTPEREKVCACGCGLPSYGRFRSGHSVQGRRKALKRMHLPLGKGKPGPKQKKRVRKEPQERKGYWKY